MLKCNLPEEFRHNRNRNPEISRTKHLYFLQAIHAACTQNPPIPLGSQADLSEVIKQWFISPVTITIMIKWKIIEHIGRGIYKWNGLKGVWTPNNLMAVEICKEEHKYSQNRRNGNERKTFSSSPKIIPVDLTKREDTLIELSLKTFTEVNNNEHLKGLTDVQKREVARLLIKEKVH